MSASLPALAAVVLAAASPSPPPALSAVAAQLGQAVGPPADGRRGLSLRVEARAPSLVAPLEAALAEALSRQGYAVAPVAPGADPEAAARQAGQDWLLRVQAGLVPGRRELALVGEVIPTWESFFLQRRPGARAQPPRLVQARVPADPETLLLGREARPPGAPFVRVRPFAVLPGRVLALAAGDAGEGPAVAAVTREAVVLLSAEGKELARREPDRAGWQPVRDPAAAVAIGDFGGGRLAVQWAGAPRAEVLARHGDRLEVVGGFAAAPLCAAEGGHLLGQFAPGTGLFQDLLSPAVDAGARPRSDRLLFGVSAAPRGGRIAYAALGADLRLELLGPDLAPAGPPAAGAVTSGVGFALADLEGGGTAEVITSLPTATGRDQLRVLAPGAERPVLYESDPFTGAFLAGASGDLTGDGVDDVVLALVNAGADGARTELLLVTSDPRELP
jgi:hypothetical protein